MMEAVPIEGEFDTIVVRRLVYAGNDDTTRGEENISEYDWYSPALGGIVKHASTSSYYDKMQGCDGRYCSAWVKNNWNVVELLTPPGALNPLNWDRMSLHAF